MTQLFFLVESAPEGGYTARALGQSIFTEAGTLDDLRARIHEAVLCHFGEGEAPEIVLLKRDIWRSIIAGLADSEVGRTIEVEEVRAQFGLPR